MKRSLFLLFILSSSLQAAISPGLFKNEKAIYDEYLRLHKNYSKYLCKPGTDKKYYDLLKSYRGEGYYLPMLLNNKLDRRSISSNLTLINKKYAWINKQLKFLKKKKSFKSAKKQIKSIEKSIDKLLKLKKIYYETDFSSTRKRTARESKVELDRLKIHWRRLMEEIPFLQGYGYPVNHFEMRKSYDIYKVLKGSLNKQKSNSIYFRRKIYEDGAQNKNRSKNDKFGRALINMMYFNLRQEKAILSENVRYDMSSILGNLKIYLSWSKRLHRERLAEWSKRTGKTIRFYKRILKDKKTKSLSLLKRKSASTYRLKKYVGRKQGKAYEYWMQYPEMYRAIFAIETILFNEVGDIDGRDALERRDVTQVVINRRFIPFYSNLDKKDKILPYLSKKAQKQSFKYPWLNTLFKTGEFSFTYYYIGATVNIFCPDMSPRGKKLRAENIRLAMEMLKNPNPKFKATRYFSRASMLGRIDMSPVWDDYQAINERAGKKVKKPSRLRRAYRGDKYKFLYGFEDPYGRKFEVIQIRKRNYVIRRDSKVRDFFKYRNPNYFKYFSAKSY